MAVLPGSSSNLELTISVPGFSSSSSPSYLPLSGDQNNQGGMKDLDINQVPSMEGEEDQDQDQEQTWYNINATTATVSMEDIIEEESISNINGGSSSSNPPRKKLRLSKEQSRLLEESFRQNHTLNPKQKEALAAQLKLRPRQVEVWFQNRRARSKLKQTEMECEYLKRWFGSLTEQNRRLQREVEELRAMKVGPPTVLSPHSCEPLPASTLTMCPRCERVTTTTASATAAITSAASSMAIATAASPPKVGTSGLQSRQSPATC